MKKVINRAALIALVLNAFSLNISSMQLSQYNCKNDSVEYPWLGEILDLYASYNYKIPESVNDLKLFADEFNQVSPKDIPYFGTLQQITFPNLCGKNVAFLEANCTLSICLNDAILAQSDLPLCCDSTKYYANNVEWVIAQRKNGEHICFYDINGKLVLRNDSLKDSFMKDRKEWLVMYQKVNPYNALPEVFNEFALVEYEYPKGLSFLCPGSDYSLSDNFWTDLESFIENFCSQYQVGKIVFLQEVLERKK